MNFILMSQNFPPAVIDAEDHRTYLEGIKAGDQGDLAPSIAFVADTLIHTQEIVLEAINKYQKESP